MRLGGTAPARACAPQPLQRAATAPCSPAGKQGIPRAHSAAWLDPTHNASCPACPSCRCTFLGPRRRTRSHRLVWARSLSSLQVGPRAGQSACAPVSARLGGPVDGRARAGRCGARACCQFPLRDAAPQPPPCAMQSVSRLAPACPARRCAGRHRRAQRHARPQVWRACGGGCAHGRARLQGGASELCMPGRPSLCRERGARCLGASQAACVNQGRPDACKRSPVCGGVTDRLHCRALLAQMLPSPVVIAAHGHCVSEPHTYACPAPPIVWCSSNGTELGTALVHPGLLLRLRSCPPLHHIADCKLCLCRLMS